MFDSSRASVHRPSPSMCIENVSARSITMRLCMFRAMPKQSKPGPRLLVVAGTVSSILCTGLRLDSSTAPIREDRTELRRVPPSSASPRRIGRRAARRIGRRAHRTDQKT
eukprot:6975699-Prymnesium_polylepis.1